jgi:hypothetical protein
VIAKNGAELSESTADRVSATETNGLAVWNGDPHTIVSLGGQAASKPALRGSNPRDRAQIAQSIVVPLVREERTAS